MPKGNAFWVTRKIVRNLDYLNGPAAKCTAHVHHKKCGESEINALSWYSIDCTDPRHKKNYPSPCCFASAQNRGSTVHVSQEGWKGSHKSLLTQDTTLCKGLPHWHSQVMKLETTCLIDAGIVRVVSHHIEIIQSQKWATSNRTDQLKKKEKDCKLCRAARSTRLTTAFPLVE